MPLSLHPAGKIKPGWSIIPGWQQGMLPIRLQSDPGNCCELPLGWSRQQRAGAGGALPNLHFCSLLQGNVFPLVQ